MEPDRKTFTREFKIETVKLITEGGASAPQVARDFDIDLDTLYTWIQEFSSKQEDVFPGKALLTSDAQLIRQLREENELLKLECETLKKAAKLSKDQS